MRFDVLTLFPAMFEAVLGDSIIGRARKKGILEMNFIDIRDFSKNKHRKTDDYPYSGGGGMLMTPQPVYDAYQSVLTPGEKKPHTVFLSPQGRPFCQERAKALSKMDRLVLLCGHYEGVDQRVLDLIVDEEISLGDFVLTGGELPAMAVIDAVSRMIPGVLSQESSYEQESHFSGLLEYPQYTRPEVWHGRSVPEILLSGHHKNIAAWKREMSIKATFQKRRGMLAKAKLSEAEKQLVQSLKEDIK